MEEEKEKKCFLCWGRNKKELKEWKQTKEGSAHQGCVMYEDNRRLCVDVCRLEEKIRGLNEDVRMWKKQKKASLTNEELAWVALGKRAEKFIRAIL